MNNLWKVLASPIIFWLTVGSLYLGYVTLAARMRLWSAGRVLREIYKDSLINPTILEIRKQRTLSKKRYYMVFFTAGNLKKPWEGAPGEVTGYFCMSPGGRYVLDHPWIQPNLLPKIEEEGK